MKNRTMLMIIALALVPAAIAAEPAAGRTWTNPKDGMEFVYVPAGPFTMGSDNGPDYEKPAHQVNLPGYWIGKTEVTVGQYRKFCGATGRPMPAAPKWGWKDDDPVVNTTWEDAAAYCKWAGVRLPTEAEWEKAARGTDGRVYPWGNAWDPTKANTSEGGPGRLTPVDSYPGDVSPYGCLDMAGNVGEWCSSLFKAYPYQADDGRENPNGLGAFLFGGPVTRGGSWGCKHGDARAAVDGKAVANLADMTLRTRGDAGTPVRLTVKHAPDFQEVSDVTLVRVPISHPADTKDK